MQNYFVRLVQSSSFSLHFCILGLLHLGVKFLKVLVRWIFWCFKYVLYQTNNSTLWVYWVMQVQVAPSVHWLTDCSTDVGHWTVTVNTGSWRHTGLGTGAWSPPPPSSSWHQWGPSGGITPTRAFSWLKAPTTSTFTFKTLLRHYAKQAFTPLSRREIGTLTQKS